MPFWGKSRQAIEIHGAHGTSLLLRWLNRLGSVGVNYGCATHLAGTDPARFGFDSD